MDNISLEQMAVAYMVLAGLALAPSVLRAVWNRCLIEVKVLMAKRRTNRPRKDR